MSENTIIAKFIDEFEAEQKRVLQLDPRERGMQAHYSRVMIVVYDMREFLRKRIDVPAIHPLKVDMASAPMAAQTAPVNVPEAVPAEPEWYTGVDGHGCRRFYHKDEVRPGEGFDDQLYTQAQTALIPSGWRIERLDYDENPESDQHAHTDYILRGPNGDQAVFYDLNNSDNGVAHRFLRDLLAAAPSSPIAANSEDAGWISVDERMPEDETPVLILRNGAPDVGEIRWDCPSLYEEAYAPVRYWDSPTNDGQDWEWHDITHWMPLPNAPSAIAATQQKKGADHD